jgi:putative transposase
LFSGEQASGRADRPLDQIPGADAPAFRPGEEAPRRAFKMSLVPDTFRWYNADMRTDVPFRSNHNLVYSCKYYRIRRIRIVWCPKYRRPVLVNDVSVRLKAILLQTAQELRSEIIELEVVSDHVHLLCEVDPQFGINRLVGRLKGRSSRLLRQEFPHLKRLPSLWTNSCFIATVGGAPLAVIKQYIEQQKDEKWQKPKRTRSSSRFRSQ